MSNSKSEHQSQRGSETIDRSLDFKRDFAKNHPEVVARATLLRAFSEIDSKNRKRTKKILKLRYLIYELQSLQPAELTDIAASLGQSLNTTRDQLQKLIKVDLVVRVAFEKNTLYCLNGNYNQFVSDTLLNGLFD